MRARREVEVLGVAHGLEEERVRAAPAPRPRCCRRAASSAATSSSGTPAGRHVDHRADEEAHHVMEEAVRLDVERQPAVALPPPRDADRAAMVVVGRRGAAHGERAEAVVARTTAAAASSASRSIGRVTAHSVARRNGECAPSSVPT